MSDTNDRANFQQFLADMIERRPERCEPRLAADVVWHWPPFAKQPPMEGREAAMEFVRNGAAPYYEEGTLSIEFGQVMVQDGQAGCRATLRGTTKRGMPYENSYAFFARIEDGLLTEVWEMMDSVRFLDQLKATPSD